MESDHLTTFQVEVARIFFGLKASVAISSPEAPHYWPAT